MFLCSSFTSLMLFSARSRERSSREYVPPPQTIARRWSAPTTAITWDDFRPRCGDATFKEHSTYSDTAIYETNTAYEELRILTKDGPEPIQEHPHCFMKCSHGACEAFVLSYMNADIIREHDAMSAPIWHLEDPFATPIRRSHQRQHQWTVFAFSCMR